MTLILTAYLDLVAACLRVRFLRIDQLLAGSVASASHAPAISVVAVKREIELTQRALRLAEHGFPVRITCLQRSVALQRLLGRRGILTQLRIGVRKERTGLKAHAWLEHQGQLLNSSAVNCNQFELLHPLPSPGDAT